MDEHVPKHGQDVHTIFVLVCTRDQRNFHLRALAAIAQTVQAADFESRCLSARSEQGLRDIIAGAPEIRAGPF